MSEKNTLLIGTFLAAIILTIHFLETPAAPPQTVAAQSAESKQKIGFQPQSKIVLRVSGSENLPGQQIASAQKNPDDDFNAKQEPHQELMARLRAWAATDINAALDYVLKMPAGDGRNDAMQALCFGLLQKNPADALALAQQLQLPETVSENLVQQWAGNDLPSALVWVNGQPAGDTRDEMMQRVILILSKTDPANAAGLIVEQFQEGPAQDEALMTLVNQWGNQNLPAATDWAEHYPFRNSALQERVAEELEGMEKFKRDLAQQ